MMSHEVSVLKTFSTENEAGMAQRVLQQNGLQAFVFKEEAGGIQLQQTMGARLLVSRVDAVRAKQILEGISI